MAELPRRRTGRRRRRTHRAARTTGSSFAKWYLDRLVMRLVVGGVCLVVAVVVGVLKGGRSSPATPAVDPPSFIAPRADGTPRPASASVRPETVRDGSFLDARQAHATRLKRRGPSPQGYEPDEVPPEGGEVVRYPSGERQLMAWFAYPDPRPEGDCPAVVFCHGGFAFGAEDWDAAYPFLDAGFAVMMPTWRGENGNPGDFELFYGEVDDARAAIRWLASRSGIDRDRIATFGHSAGGGVSALLSLYDEPAIWVTGSAGGLYAPETFEGWAEIVPFDPGDETECRLRVLAGNQAEMKARHIAYVGEDDDGIAQDLPSFREETERTGAALTIVVIPGTDHYSSLEPALSAFAGDLERLRAGRWSPVEFSSGGGAFGGRFGSGR